MNKSKNTNAINLTGATNLIPDYDLELESIVREIIRRGARVVCLQLPAGLKVYSKIIQEFLERKTGSQIVIWADSCFGSCDIPELEKKGIDMLIHFGHSKLCK